AAIAALSLSACGGGSGASGANAGDEQASGQAVSVTGVKTLHEGQLTIGSDLTYPPYNTLENGKPAGFDVEFMDAVAGKLGLETNYIDTRFAQIIAGIKSRQYDVIASTLYVSKPRSEQVD